MGNQRWKVCNLDLAHVMLQEFDRRDAQHSTMVCSYMLLDTNPTKNM